MNTSEKGGFLYLCRDHILAHSFQTVPQVDDVRVYGAHAVNSRSSSDTKGAKREKNFNAQSPWQLRY